MGTVSSVECTMNAGRILGHGGSVRGYSGGPAFSLKTGALFAMNVSGPDLKMFINDSLHNSLGDILQIAKETTYSLMISINGII